MPVCTETARTGAAALPDLGQAGPWVLGMGGAVGWVSAAGGACLGNQCSGRASLLPV